MMDMVESDEDSGLPSVAGHEPGPPTSRLFMFHATYDTMLLLPLCPLSASAHFTSC